MNQQSTAHDSRPLRYGMAAALALGLVLLVGKLAVAPVRGVHNAAECHDAYASAQTRSDSMSVDFLSFPDPARRRIMRRCHEVRPAPTGAPGR